MELVAGFCLICGLYLVIRFVCFVVRQLIMLPGRPLRRRRAGGRFRCKPKITVGQLSEPQRL